MRMLCPFPFKELICLFIVSLFYSFDLAQKNEIELNEVHFADIQITFSKGAERQLETLISQYESEPLLKNIHQLESYLSLLDKSLEKEKVPQDYKYLCLYKYYLSKKENSKDGFWNLETDKARQLNLRVDNQIDERFNLVSSTYEVAKEMRRNNIYFANWLINMLTIEMGFQNTREYVLSHYSRSDVVGNRKWLITEETHPRIIEIVAFKLFVEQKMSSHFQGKVKILVDSKQERKTLKQIANDNLISEVDLKKYNLWLNRKRIPDDKIYPVLIPIPQTGFEPSITVQNDISQLDARITDQDFVKPTENNELPVEDYYSLRKSQEELRQIIEQQEREYYAQQGKGQDLYKTVGTTPISTPAATHEVLLGQTLYEIARLYNISVYDLREYNQLKQQEDIYPGQVLYLSTFSAPVNNTISPTKVIHTVRLGENLSIIARAYQVSVNDLILWNQIASSDYIRLGQNLTIYVYADNHRILKTSQNSINQFSVLRGQPFNTAQKLSSSVTEEDMPMRGASKYKSSNKNVKLLWIPTLKK